MRYALLMEPEPERAAEVEESARALQDCAGYWTLHALEQGGGAILELAHETWRTVTRMLKAHGLDAQTLRSEGRLVVLDADKVSAEITCYGGLRPDNFEELIRGAAMRIRSVAGGNVHAWSEIGLLLERHNDPWTARFARKLWSQSARRHGLRLLGPGTTGNDPATMSDADGWAVFVGSPTAR